MTDSALKHVYTGKVRELYEVAHDRLLMVASDRVSVFDVVLPDEIPDKGRVLTGLSSWWFDRTADLVPNHVISADPTDFPEVARDVEGRAMLVRATRPIRLECVVRGYVFGHGWSEYCERGTVGGQSVPAGIDEAGKLPEPLFTPTTKADVGHDLSLDPDAAIALVGADRYAKLRELSLRLYEFGAHHAASCGVILADTKFEFGELDGEILLIDEVMTPDSSRYWPAERYRPGGSPPSFDKQFVRDHMDHVGWDRVSPPPHMPTDVIDSTRGRYVEAYETITGQSFDEWFGPEN
ncbi:MAG TPA: phosphoribosylaminoimidazolesuccinocarboxamide synthase [Acidimicrobiia bacterium]|nr:phosphoribosylaminoimidazolesuccinocarboxamide synthase [Acidimicrobiia bacterium]